MGVAAGCSQSLLQWDLGSKSNQRSSQNLSPKEYLHP
ncbi:hypothetical protein SLEP1_g56379 [Rubroshorea leprosula]|uniref:Uncharacterized protein n=1 Tax=Rubroshorea leprosula TaxID=152421 RepID=A0AAV5MJF2_9ROSI|nr:hypothetical protein SLEP1_g56379 [Rubroshorea leprosula]